MKLTRLLILVSLFLSSANVRAAADGGIESPFAFGAGARELALGGAALSYTDGVTAPFWNASRLAGAEHLSLGAYHCRLYESDVAYQYVGLVFPTLDFGGFGLGIFRLGVEGIEKRDENNLLLGEFNDNRLGFYLAYGRSLSGYDIGVSLSMESHSVDTYSATSSPGLTLSVSRAFEPGLSNVSQISVTVVGRNLIAPSVQLDGTDVSYPRAADLSVTTALLPDRGWNQSLLLSATVTNVEAVDPRLAAGLEYNLQDLLYLRGGVRDNKLSFGAGLCYSLLSFDYALVDRDLGSLHMFSITTDFGRSVSERRELRSSQRENQFRQLMDQRITQQNEQMVTELVAEGERLLSQSEYASAVDLLDRALFLARGTGGDTASIAALAATAHDELDEYQRGIDFARYIDSTQVRLDSEDYLSARYFATQAQLIEPDSPDAIRLMAQIDSAIQRAESHEQMIRRQLWLIDSLINYGQTERALSVAKSLTEFAPENADVKIAAKRARFEHLRSSATDNYEQMRYEVALNQIDSALTLFPGHRWCLDLRGKITRERSASAQIAVEGARPKTTQISEKILKEIERDYRDGQESFARGELEVAVEKWEKVITLAPDYMSVRQYLVKAYKFVGVELYGQDRLADAIAVWKKAARLEPNNSEISGYIERAENEMRNLRELSYDDR